jgi:hypothetical protein
MYQYVVIRTANEMRFMAVYGPFKNRIEARIYAVEQLDLTMDDLDGGRFGIREIVPPFVYHVPKDPIPTYSEGDEYYHD